MGHIQSGNLCHFVQRSFLALHRGEYLPLHMYVIFSEPPAAQILDLLDWSSSFPLFSFLSVLLSGTFSSLDLNTSIDGFVSVLVLCISKSFKILSPNISFLVFCSNSLKVLIETSLNKIEIFSYLLHCLFYNFSMFVLDSAFILQVVFLFLC